MILTQFVLYTAQKIKFSIKGFFSKCDQIKQFEQHMIKEYI